MINKGNVKGEGVFAKIVRDAQSIQNTDPATVHEAQPSYDISGG